MVTKITIAVAVAVVIIIKVIVLIYVALWWKRVNINNIQCHIKLKFPIVKKNKKNGGGSIEMN